MSYVVYALPNLPDSPVADGHAPGHRRYLSRTHDWRLRPTSLHHSRLQPCCQRARTGQFKEVMAG